MARKKSYDRDEALLRARNAFWQDGYAQMGVRELGEKTGINRFALQTEFGGKQGLFLEVLDRYADAASTDIVAPMLVGGLDAIEAFFDALTTQQPDDPRDMGCLMVNTVVENAGSPDPDIARATSAHYDNMLRGFRAALGNARTKGELVDNLDIDAAAAHLLAVGMGIQVYVRNAGAVRHSAPQMPFVRSLLNSWRA